MAHLHKQGELGNMEKYTKVELIDLLNRQQNLLRNGKFLQKLPDKGKKLQIFAEKLELLIKEREQIDQTAELFEKMRIVQKNHPVSDSQLDSDDEEEGDVMEKEEDGDGASDEKKCLDGSRSENSQEIRERTMVESSVRENLKEQKVKQESVFKKKISSQKGNATGNPFLKSHEQKREVFRPYKTLHSNKLPDDIPKPQPLPMKLKSHFPRDKVEEISAVTPPRLKHPDGSKLVDIEESVILEQEQQKKYEELCAKQAAERLAQRMNVTMESYLPDQEEIAYREAESVDSDSDSEADENEQPVLED